MRARGDKASAVLEAKVLSRLRLSLLLLFLKNPPAAKLLYIIISRSPVRVVPLDFHLFTTARTAEFLRKARPGLRYGWRHNYLLPCARRKYLPHQGENVRLANIMQNSGWFIARRKFGYKSRARRRTHGMFPDKKREMPPKDANVKANLFAHFSLRRWARGNRRLVFGTLLICRWFIRKAAGLSLLSSPVAINIENALFQQQEMNLTAAHLSFTHTAQRAGGVIIFSTPSRAARSLEMDSLAPFNADGANDGPKFTSPPLKL